MTTIQALGRGTGALRRRPALLLLPLLWDVAQMGLAYRGIPAVPVWPALTVGSPATGSVRGFVPTALPSLANLNIPLTPALQTPLEQASPWGILLVLLLIPLAEALVESVYFGLLADSVAARRPDVRRALSNWPAFAVLAVAWRIAPLILPTVAGVYLGIVWSLLFPVLPFVIGVLDRPLPQALAEAPGIFWGRFGHWVGLGLVSMIATFLATGLWTLTRQSVFAAALVYPALATVLAGAAAALCQAAALPAPAASEGTGPEGPGPEAAVCLTDGPAERPGEPAAACMRSFLVLLVALVAAGLASVCVQAWKGWQPTREAALSPQPGAYAPMMFAPPTHSVLKVVDQPEGELVISRTGDQMLAVSALRRSRFGWQHMSSQWWPSEPGREPAGLEVTTQPDGGGRVYQPQWLVVGEIFDQRVAYLQIGGDRFPIGQDGPIFIVRPGYPPNPPFAFLDAQGQPIRPAEVKRP